MHWKSPARGRGEVCRWTGREESGLQMRQRGGVRDERDAGCACVTEFSHLDGQLARPIPLTDRAPSPYLQRGVSNFLLAISIWELRSCACVTFESWSNRDCFKGSYFPQRNGLVLSPLLLSPPPPLRVINQARGRSRIRAQQITCARERGSPPRFMMGYTSDLDCRPNSK